MVIIPVPAALLEGLPDMEPNRALPITAAFAGPPLMLPTILSVNFVRYSGPEDLAFQIKVKNIGRVQGFTHRRLNKYVQLC